MTRNPPRKTTRRRHGREDARERHRKNRERRKRRARRFARATDPRLATAREELARLEAVKSGLDYPGGRRKLDADMDYLREQIARLENRA